MNVDQMVPILLAKVQEFERKKQAGIKIKATAMRWQQRPRAADSSGGRHD